MEEKKSIMSGFAVASLVLGICSFFTLFGLEKPVCALVFGIIGLKRIKAYEMRGKGLATAGIILGGIGIVVVLFVLVVYGPQIVKEAVQQQQ